MGGEGSLHQPASTRIDLRELKNGPLSSKNLKKHWVFDDFGLSRNSKNGPLVVFSYFGRFLGAPKTIKKPMFFKVLRNGPDFAKNLKKTSNFWWFLEHPKKDLEGVTCWCLGTYWSQHATKFDFGSISGRLGPNLAQLGPNLAPTWPILAACWAHVDHLVGKLRT